MRSTTATPAESGPKHSGPYPVHGPLCCPADLPADPAARPRYVAAARRRLRDVRRGRRRERCLVCGASGLAHRTLTFARDESLTTPVRICPECGYVRCVKEAQSNYLDIKDFDSLPGARRAGTLQRKGREFHMGKMGVDILARDDVEVLVDRPGRSLDNHHIAKLPEVRRVVLGDIMKVRDDAEFIDAKAPPPERFQVVVACEVIEHFRDPWADFTRLLRLVDRDGIVVCGTDLYDGGDLSKQRYIFFPDHTSYYSPKALRLIAKSFGFHLDFRSVGGPTGPRKRYVIFSRSKRTMEQVADYFGTHDRAPAEPAKRTKKPAA